MQKQKDNVHTLASPYAKYVELYECAPAGYFSLDAKGQIYDVNEAGATLLGIEKEQLLNTCFTRYIAADSLFEFSQYCQQVLLEDMPQKGIFQFRRWTGDNFFAQLESRITHDKKKKMLILMTDITQEKKYEQSLQHQYRKIASIDRICSMNEVAFSILQPLNESLTVIDNYLCGCMRRLESGNYNADELLRALRQIGQQSNRLIGMAMRMKSYTARDVFRYEVVDLDSMLTETVSLLRQEADPFIKIHCELAINLPQVKIDKAHIQHVILNIAHNAIESMQEAQVKDPQLIIRANIMANDNYSVAISLLDNGPGYKPEIAEKLFDPHFTTKPYKMGLGLTISRSIIEKHGGELRTHLLELGGTCFQLVLPCVAVAHKKASNAFDK